MTSMSISDCSSERYPSSISPSISSSISSPPSSVGDEDHKSTTPEPVLELSITSPQEVPILLDVDLLQDKINNGSSSPPRSNQIPLRHSPSMSVITSKTTQINRTRANSLTSTCSLAERRGSKTSAYLGTEDFKKNFASKLNSVKARERTQSSEPNNWLAKSNVWNFPSIEETSPTLPSDRDFTFNRHQSQPNKICGLAPSAIPPRGDKLHDMINHLLALPTDELAAQLEMHFNRLEPGRDAEELEARNEVISTLADQLANQLEANDKLLFDLGCLRSAHASLSSELADVKDEMASLLSTMNGTTVENHQLSKVKLQSEDQIRDLRKALEESKIALGRLQLEQQSKDRRRSLQNYQATLNLVSSNSSHLGGPKRSGSLLLGKDLNHGLIHKRLSLSDGGNSNSNQENHFLRPGFLFSNTGKPIRPPRSPARSSTPSPILSEEPWSTGTSDKEELELLRLQCTQLRIELNESEDSRLASQAALDALKTFISSNGTTEASSVKLPPLPTDIESPISKPRWGLLSRTFVTPPSPNAAFSGFGLWGKKPRESEELQTQALTNLPVALAGSRRD